MGELPSAAPPTAADYTRAGLPSFTWYDERPALDGSPALAVLTSVHALEGQSGEAPLQENEAFEPAEPMVLRAGLSMSSRSEG
jgi:hypothetical protein